MDQPERRIPDPGFAGDDGSVPAAVAAALAAYGDDPAGARVPALAAVQDARVLVPVVAVLGEMEHGDDGLAREKSSDMAAVLMTGADGRTALLAFTGQEPLQRWDPDARPVPVSARTAARSAVQEGAAALVLDIAGPVPLAVEGGELEHLAAGHRLVRVGEGWGWAARVRRTGPESPGPVDSA